MVRTLRVTPQGGVPNHRDLPVVIAPRASPGCDADGIRSRIAANGRTGIWIRTVFDYRHCHPNAHEALAVVAGRATLVPGGRGGARVHVTAGDCLILPAGTGRKRDGASGEFRLRRLSGRSGSGGRDPAHPATTPRAFAASLCPTPIRPAARRVRC